MYKPDAVLLKNVINTNNNPKPISSRSFRPAQQTQRAVPCSDTAAAVAAIALHVTQLYER